MYFKLKKECYLSGWLVYFKINVFKKEKWNEIFVICYKKGKFVFCFKLLGVFGW